MNFISLLTRINSLFFLFLLLQITGEVKGDAHFQSISQPLSASFPIPSRIRNQNITDIILKDDGMLILATQNCLCIYNGSQWDYVSTSGIPIIETTKDGLIYVADERGPGLLSLDSSLHYRIYPLLHPDSDTSERPDDIEDLISIANDLYLLSAGRLFLYDRDKFIKFSGCNRVDTIYKVSQRLIVSTPEGFYPIIRHKRGEKYSMEGQQPDFILPHSTGYLIYRKKENSFFITTPSLRIVKTWE